MSGEPSSPLSPEPGAGLLVPSRSHTRTITLPVPVATTLTPPWRCVEEQQRVAEQERASDWRGFADVLAARDHALREGRRLLRQQWEANVVALAHKLDAELREFRVTPTAETEHIAPERSSA